MPPWKLLLVVLASPFILVFTILTIVFMCLHHFAAFTFCLCEGKTVDEAWAWAREDWQSMEEGSKHGGY